MNFYDSIFQGTRQMLHEKSHLKYYKVTQAQKSPGHDPGWHWEGAPDLLSSTMFLMFPTFGRSHGAMKWNCAVNESCQGALTLFTKPLILFLSAWTKRLSRNDFSKCSASFSRMALEIWKNISVNQASQVCRWYSALVLSSISFCIRASLGQL